MTIFTYGSTGHADWLLDCADRLDSEGEHGLAGEARDEAATMQQPKATTAPTRLPCEDCGRPVSLRQMPEDWPFDWWSHALTGRSCLVRAL